MNTGGPGLVMVRPAALCVQRHLLMTLPFRARRRGIGLPQQIAPSGTPSGKSRMFRTRGIIAPPLLVCAPPVHGATTKLVTARRDVQFDCV
jgi:hypothetical protein